MFDVGRRGSEGNEAVTHPNIIINRIKEFRIKMNEHAK